MRVSVLAGLLNGAIVQYLGINAFIVTLGTLTAIRGVVQIYTDGRSLSVDTPEALQAMRLFESGPPAHRDSAYSHRCGAAIGGMLAPAASTARSTQSPGDVVWHDRRRSLLPCSRLGGWMSLAMPKPVVYMAVFTMIVWFVLSMTNVGRRVYAVGGNPEAARLSGINVKRYKMAGFILV